MGQCKLRILHLPNPPGMKSMLPVAYKSQGNSVRSLPEQTHSPITNGSLPFPYVLRYGDTRGERKTLQGLLSLILIEQSLWRLQSSRVPQPLLSRHIGGFTIYFQDPTSNPFPTLTTTTLFPFSVSLSSSFSLPVLIIQPRQPSHLTSRSSIFSLPVLLTQPSGCQPPIL